MLRVVNLVKILSAFVFLGTLSLVYAYMPIMVKLDEEGTAQVHKENFFYFSIAVFISVNLVVLVIQKILNQRPFTEMLKVWIGGFTFVINLYLAFIIGFMGVINNAAHIPASNYFYLNWLGPILLLAWLSGLIFLVVKKE